MLRRYLCILMVISCVSNIALAQTNLSKGYQIFLNRGLVLSGWADEWDGLNAANWNASKHNTVNIINAPYLGGGRNFAVVTFDDGTFKPSTYNWYTPAQAEPYLTFAQVGDEQDLFSGQMGQFRQPVANLQAAHPNTLIFMNQSVLYNDVRITPALLNEFTQTVKPDMLFFTEYPFRFQGTNNSHDYEGGSPTEMYEHMGMYRNAGLAGIDGTGNKPIPVGMYVQRYAHMNNSVTNGRHPTQSEFNLQQFAAWAFGFRMTNSFVYSSQTAYGTTINSTSFYGTGDDNPTAAFYQIAELNRQSQNLSPALVKLMTTDVRMKMGKQENGSNNDTPDGISAWDSSADAYLKNVSAVNLGSKNNGMEGDVIVGFYNPLDDSLVQAGAEDDVYFMIVNGLSDETGDAADCAQEITLQFDFADSGITKLQRISRDTGEIEVVNLILEQNGMYSLILTLDGGTGDLFKYDTGTAFVPEPATLGLLTLGAISLIRRKKI